MARDHLTVLGTLYINMTDLTSLAVREKIFHPEAVNSPYEYNIKNISEIVSKNASLDHQPKLKNEIL